MFTPDEETFYSDKFLKIRAVIVFLVYIFVFLAAGTEVIDVANAYLNLLLSPKVALLIVVMLQSAVWILIEHHDKPNGVYIFAGFVLVSFIGVIAETIIGDVVLFEYAVFMRKLSKFQKML